MPMPDRITRLAPSPTGALHLGNARTFLINWLLARQNGWRVLLRIEDLDGPRVKQNADAELIDDLRWLGIDWDEGPMYQSTRAEAYTAACDRLLKQNDAYACVCTRKEISLAASAPHAEDGAAVYPGTCHGRFSSLDAARAFLGNDKTREPAIRLRVPEGPIGFTDTFAGDQHWNDPANQLGDFVIRKNDGLAAYQLAVVVDDAEAGVTDVVRGDDLIDSTPRQIMLYRALGLADRIPRYTHLPLVVGTDGRRLAKRHGDTRIATFKANGAKPTNVLRLLARWCGMDQNIDAISARDLLDGFDILKVSKEQIVFTEEDREKLSRR